MIPNGGRQANLCLPHAFGTAFSPAVQEENNGPEAVIIGLIILRKVNLETISRAVKLQRTVEKACLLRTGWVGKATSSHGKCMAGAQRTEGNATAQKDSKETVHDRFP